jgi:hypothetical protein
VTEPAGVAIKAASVDDDLDEVIVTGLGPNEMTKKIPSL